ncbi:MAG: mucoidy inhibitor MuiA family protein [Lachnospiraceae bacterium]|nr:mucoidy inhibitor MuiA family protein [Lachnospiraceae bacterium]
MTDTRITSVSVYRSGCIITRTAEVELEQGTQTVQLRGPGPAADPQSLRLSVPENVQGANVQMDYLTEEQKKEILKELAKKQDKVTRSIKDTEEQIALWKQNADFSAKESISLADMTAFLEQLPERLAALQDRRDALLEEQEALKKEREKLTEQNNKPFVSVELTAPAAGRYPVELRYKDESAAWEPSYELHTQDEDSGRLLLRLRARIAQDTGEDWKQASLTLFSGNPSVSGTIPTLYPARLHFYEPVRMMAKGLMGGSARTNAAPMMMEETAMLDMEDAAPAPLMKMSQVMADSGRTVQGDTMTEYELTGRWDIRNGQSILCDLRTDEIPCRYQVVAVPKRTSGCFLSAEVKTADLEEMQNVEAAVYLKGTFAGNVWLQPDMTEDTYDLSLGKDETVKVKRTQKKKYTSTVLLKGQKKTEYEFEISVSSRKPKPCQVLVRDQIPITEEKSIQVETVNLSGGELDVDTGLVKWNFTLQPGETRQLTLAYTTAWPKDKQLQEG